MANEKAVSGQLGGVVSKVPRKSNLELYRIVCMLMIVAHHFVVNSGVASNSCGPVMTDPLSANSIFLTLFGAWGKTGINCFLMITGYFMCTSEITLRKFLKLLAQIYLYKLIIFPIFVIVGYEPLSPVRLIRWAMPLWGLKDHFVGCFLVFFLTIPFWNMLIRQMKQRQYLLLLALLLGCYTLLGSIPSFNVSFNYVTWFGIVYLVASYIRLYPSSVFERRSLWGGLTLVTVLLAIVSVVIIHWLFAIYGKATLGHQMLNDSNRIFAVLVAFCSFLWFKNMDLKYSKVINAFGAGTFGVLLIHANSDAMRQWLWKDTVDVVGHYTLPLGQLILYSIGVVMIIFIICNLIDQLRIATLEKWFFRWYDKKVSAKADAFIQRITQ